MLSISRVSVWRQLFCWTANPGPQWKKIAATTVWWNWAGSVKTTVRKLLSFLYWTTPTLWGKTRQPNTCVEQWTVCLKLKVFSNNWTEWPDSGYILRQYGIFDWKKYNSLHELGNRSTWDHTAVAAFNICWWALFLLILYSFSKPLIISYNF